MSTVELPLLEHTAQRAREIIDGRTTNKIPNPTLKGLMDNVVRAVKAGEVRIVSLPQVPPYKVGDLFCKIGQSLPKTIDDMQVYHCRRDCHHDLQLELPPPELTKKLTEGLGIEELILK